MAYGDGLMIMWAIPGAVTVDKYAGGISTPTEGVLVEDAAADISSYIVGCPMTLLAFGAWVNERFNATAADFTVKPVTSLDRTPRQGVRTEILALTLDAIALKRGDGIRRAQTPIVDVNDVLIGDVFMFTGTAVPAKLQAGDMLHWEHKVAATGAGADGEYIPFALFRLDGYDLVNTNIIS